MIYTCSVCDRRLASSQASRNLLWQFPPAVPYVTAIRSEPNETPSYCCADCADDADRPGKFQANYGRTDLARCLILHAWSLDGSEDDFMSSEGWGYLGRFGRYLLHEDTSGFVTFEDYDTSEKAAKRFEELYADGWGAQEDDAYIWFERGRWHAQMDGKTLNLWSPQNRQDLDYDEGITERRAIARVRLESAKTGYYPNLWRQNERGDLTLLTY